MANLRTDNLCGEGGRNAYRGSVFFSRGTASSQSDSFNFSGIAIGTSDFTIEGWLYKTKTGNYPVIFDTRESGNSDAGGFFLGTNSDDYFYFYTQSTNAIKQTIISNFSWYHFALVRTGGTTTLYLNGQVSGTYSDSNNYSNDITKLGTSQQYTGGVQNNWNWGGYLSNIRIVVGSAVYTSAFTPPTSELKAISNTKLLCCQNSDDPTQEETGRTLTGVGNHATVGYNKTQPKVIPPFGVDAGNTFNGAISMNSSAYMNFPTGRTEERGRGRAVFGGGQSTSYTSAIQTFNIQSQGNTVEVSELTSARWGLAAAGSATRALFGGGRTSPGGSGTYLNTIEFVTIANVANSIDFGDLTRAGSYINALGNETRGIWAGGYDVDNKPATNIGLNTIDYVTIATAGNAADFGDMVRQDGSSDTTFSKFTTANSTRGLIAGGYNSGGEQDEITYITIATTGNSTYFGDLTAVSAFGGSGASSSTRGILTVGGTPGPHNRIDFVTIATTGNATDFGDLTLARRYAQGVSNKTRAVFITGYTGSDTNLIDFVTIATTGNATDFGDNDREDNYGNGATSDSHGGLS